jgi:putative transposase
MMLIPELTRPNIVVMDNASFHNKSNIIKLLNEHGHKLFSLPPYSPEFNPIEQLFAVLKKCQEFSKSKLTIDELLLSRFI